MFGLRAVELLRELKRNRTLPPYEDRGVKDVLEEITSIYQDIMTIVQTKDIDARNPYIATSLVVYHQSILRNKRCLLAYHMARLNMLKELRWDVGRYLPSDIRTSMCAAEQKFFDDYSLLAEDYIGAIGLDLATDLTPPKDLYVVVRVLKDHGEIMTESGPVNLAVCNIHAVLITDSETRLIIYQEMM